MSEKTIAVDLDGVIFEYRDWKGIEHFGKPIKNVRRSLEMFRKMGFKIVVYTCRTNPKLHPEYPLPQLELMVRKALLSAEIPFDEVAIGGKPIALYYIDDRGIRFNSWEDALMKITALEKARADKFE